MRGRFRRPIHYKDKNNITTHTHNPAAAASTQVVSFTSSPLWTLHQPTPTAEGQCHTAAHVHHRRAMAQSGSSKATLPGGNQSNQMQKSIEICTY